MEAVVEDEHVEYEEESTDGEEASQGSDDDHLADGDDESVTLVEPSLAVFIIDRSFHDLSLYDCSWLDIS
jgi:hypothetical protein